MTPKTNASLLVVAIMTLNAGCQARWDIAPHRLMRLDGFKTGETVEVDNGYGEAVPIHEKTTFHFVGKDDLEAEARFRSITVEGTAFRGIDSNSKVLNVDTSQLRRVYATNPETGKYVLGTLGLIVAVPLAVGSIFGFVLISTGH